MSATGVRSQTLSLHPSRDIAEAALAAILEHSGASVSIINADDGDGFLVQDLVNDESAVKVSVDFSGADATCPIIIRGPSAEARASYDRISRVVMQTEQEQSAREQLLPEKLTARRQTPATDGSLHFRLDVDERFVDPPASHRRQPQGPRESLGANPKPGFDQSLEDIRNHGRDYSVENDSGSNDEMSYSAEGDSIGGFENHRHSFALNSTLRSRQGASFQQRTSRADKPPLRPPRQVSPPRQHGGAKISSYQLSKVLAKLKAQSYELGGVNMTAEFQRADTSGTGCVFEQLLDGSVVGIAVRVCDSVTGCLVQVPQSCRLRSHFAASRSVAATRTGICLRIIRWEWKRRDRVSRICSVHVAARRRGCQANCNS